MDHLTGRFHTVHGANATVQLRCGNQFEIILMKEKAAGNLWDVIERLHCANVEARCDAVSSSLGGIYVRYEGEEDKQTF